VSVEEVTQTRAEPAPRAGAAALALRWGWLLPLIAAFGPTFAWLWERWTRSVMDNGHGMFMPLVAAYLVREQLRSDPISGPRSSAAGFAFVIAGLAMLVLDTVIRSELLGAAGLVVVLPGLSLLLLGAQRTRLIALPLLIAAMMLPVPAGFVAKLHLVLRHVTAAAVEQIVPLFGPAIAREGTLLYLPKTLVSVADACSGFGTLYASVATTLILAQLVRTRARRIALFAACLPVALITNWIRVSALVLIAHYWGPEWLHTKMHEGTGFATFVVALAVLFAIAGREVMPDPAARPVATPVATRFSVPLALLCALALVPVALNSYAGRRLDDCAHPSVLLAGTGIADPERRAARARELGERFEAFAFREGVIRDPEGLAPDLAYTILRTYDAKRTYYRPEYWLSGHREPAKLELDRIDVDGRAVPVRRIEFATRDDEVYLAGYLVVYEGEPVANPVRAQLLAAPGLVLRGSLPMTLYYAQVVARPEQADAASQALERWLAGSWRQYDSICRARPKR
jgi:exosortase